MVNRLVARLELPVSAAASVIAIQEAAQQKMMALHRGTALRPAVAGPASTMAEAGCGPAPGRRDGGCFGPDFRAAFLHRPSGK
jgi:hypothetical protein